MSLRTPRGPFRFGRRRRESGGEAVAHSAPSSADTHASPRPEHNHGTSPALDPDPEAALLQPPPPPLRRGSEHPGADGVWDREGFRVLDKDRDDGPDAGDLPRRPALGEARTRLLSRASMIAPHPTGTVHVRKAGLPARLRSASRIARTRTASSNASGVYAVRGRCTRLALAFIAVSAQPSAGAHALHCSQPRPLPGPVLVCCMPDTSAGVCVLCIIQCTAMPEACMYARAAHISVLGQSIGIE